MLVFDIETGPLPDDDLKQAVPAFDRESIPRPGVFDPDSVKTGNIKDQAKIAEKIHAARKAYEAEVASYDDRVNAAEAAYWQEIKDRAALDATTGWVTGIGFLADSGKRLVLTALDGTEEERLAMFWKQFHRMRTEQRKIVGHYSNAFDVPFLCRRSWILGVEVPEVAFTPTGWLNPIFVDLADRWRCGNRQTQIKLDAMARAIGVGCKPDDCTGAEFSELLLSGDPEKQERAISYLHNDLDMTLGCALKLLKAT